MNKALKIVLIILGTFVGIFMLLAAIVSPIAKIVIEKNSKTWTSRQIVMDDLSVNLYTGSVCAEGIVMKEDDDTTDFVRFDTLSVSINYLKLIGKEVDVRHITLAKPKVLLVQKDSTFNFSSIINFYSTPDEEKEDEEVEENSTPWKIGLYNIRLSNGELLFQDEAHQSSWNLKDLNLAIPGIYFSGQSTDAGLSFNFAEGGEIATQAKYNMESSRYDVSVKLTNFALKNILPYAKDFVKISDLKGNLNIDANACGSTKQPTDIDIKGIVSLKNIDAIDEQNSSIANLSDLTITIDSINPQKGICDIASISLDGLSSAFVMTNSGNNFSSILKSQNNETDTIKQQPQTPDTAATQTKPMHVRINKIDVKNCNFTYEDHTLQNPFIYPLTQIEISSHNFDIQKETNELKLKAQTPAGGFAFIDWKGSVESLKNQSLTLILKNVRVSDFSPYSMKFFAYPFSSGNLSFTSQNIVKDFQLNGQNKIDIYNCRVGDKDKTIDPEINLPLKTGLYILKDRNDKILLDLPISGNINSPEFSYKKLILKTLGNLLLKLVASPFDAIAKSLGISGDGLDRIEIDPLQMDLSSEQYATLTRISEIAKAKEELKISFTQQFSLLEASKEMALLELKKQYYLTQQTQSNNEKITLVDSEEIKKIKETDNNFKSFVDSIGNGNGGNIYDKAFLLNPQDSINAKILKLAQMRNRFVSTYMTEKMGVDTSRIQVNILPENELKEYNGKDMFKIGVME